MLISGGKEAASQIHTSNIGGYYSWSLSWTLLDQDSQYSFNKELLNTNFFFSFPISKFDVGRRARNKTIRVLPTRSFIGWPGDAFFFQVGLPFHDYGGLLYCSQLFTLPSSHAVCHVTWQFLSLEDGVISLSHFWWAWPCDLL